MEVLTNKDKLLVSFSVMILIRFFHSEHDF